MRRADLVPDCASCAAVCCVATSFDASEDFALDKPAGVACQYLRRDCRCAIHGELVARGFQGCAVYDCFGAGPRVTRAFAARRDCDRERNAAFLVLRIVHELLWLLTEAAKVCERAGGPAPSHMGAAARDTAAPTALVCEIAAEVDSLDAIARDMASDPLAVDLHEHSDRAYALLRRVGDQLGHRRAARLLVVVD